MKPEETADYERELRNKIKALGGSAGGRSSISTLEKQLSELESSKLSELESSKQYARKWTVSADQRVIKVERVEVTNDDMTLILPENVTPMVAKRKLNWFMRVIYRYFNYAKSS